MSQMPATVPPAYVERPAYIERPVVANPVVTGCGTTAWPAHPHFCMKGILSGAMTAIAFQFVFTVLGIAIGLSVIGDARNTTAVTIEDVESAATTGYVWWLVTGTIALLIGGLMTGRIARPLTACSKRRHGITMWSVTAIFGFLVIWSAAGAGASAGSPMGAMSVRDMGSRMSGMDGRMGDGSVRGTDGAAVRTADGTRAVTNANVDAETRAQMERARKAAQLAAWWAFGGMLIGAGVSWLGVILGSPKKGERRDRYDVPDDMATIRA
ncbi:hypothetical protein BH11PLA1_BH11PLA1_07280 [soil metagenome]